MKQNTTTITKSIKTLEHWFDIVNDLFYKNRLEKPIITLMPDHKKKALGWFTTWRAWTENEKKYHEINITADYAFRKPIEIMETLMHECVHLYNSMNDIQDTSRTGTYHNAKFKTTAEEHGLKCEKDSKYGWTKTSLKEESKNKLELALYGEPKFEIMHREQPDKQTKKSKSYRHICPICGAKARTTKPIRLICAECYMDSEDNIMPEDCMMEMEQC